MTPRRLLSLVLTVGVAARLTLALLVRGTPAPAAAALGGRALPPAQKVPIPPRGPVTLAARADDPDGQDPWAVRRFTTTQRKQTYPCVQLGRLDAGRFGWIAPDAPFRVARFDQLDVPTMCGERFPRGLPQLTVTTLTTNGRVGLPLPARTIVWGVLPPGTTGARLDDGTTLRVGRDRVALAVLAGRPVDLVKLVGTLTLSGGGSRRFDFPALHPQAVVQRRGPDGRVTQAQRHVRLQGVLQRRPYPPHGAPQALTRHGRRRRLTGAARDAVRSGSGGARDEQSRAKRGVPRRGR